MMTVRNNEKLYTTVERILSNPSNQDTNVGEMSCLVKFRPCMQEWYLGKGVLSRGVLNFHGLSVGSTVCVCDSFSNIVCVF